MGRDVAAGDDVVGIAGNGNTVLEPRKLVACLVDVQVRAVRVNAEGERPCERIIGPPRGGICGRSSTVGQEVASRLPVLPVVRHGLGRARHVCGIAVREVGGAVEPIATAQLPAAVRRRMPGEGLSEPRAVGGSGGGAALGKNDVLPERHRREAGAVVEEAGSSAARGNARTHVPARDVEVGEQGVTAEHVGERGHVGGVPRGRGQHDLRERRVIRKHIAHVEGGGGIPAVDVLDGVERTAAVEGVGEGLNLADVPVAEVREIRERRSTPEGACQTLDVGGVGPQLDTIDGRETRVILEEVGEGGEALGGPGANARDGRKVGVILEQARDGSVELVGETQARAVEVNQVCVILKPTLGVRELDAAADDDVANVGNERVPRESGRDLGGPVDRLIVDGKVSPDDLGSADGQGLVALVITPPGVGNARAVLEAAAGLIGPDVLVGPREGGTVRRV